MDTFLDEEGISHEFSATYTPQQNGVAERKNWTLIEVARMMLDEYEMPRHFWAEAVETTCHATNRLYLHKLLGKTAYEILDTSILHHAFISIFIALWTIISLYITILMAILSYFTRFT